VANTVWLVRIGIRWIPHLGRTLDARQGRGGELILTIEILALVSLVEKAVPRNFVSELSRIFCGNSCCVWD